MVKLKTSSSYVTLALLWLSHGGCSVSSSTVLESSTDRKIADDDGYYRPPAGSTESQQQQTFQARDVTYIVTAQPIRLRQDLAPMLDKLRARRGQENTLVCAQTIEIEGLFLCGGTSRVAQHIPLMRAAIYAEARPSIGVQSGGQVVSQQVAAGVYQKSAGHDLPQSLIQSFFSKAKSICPDLSCLLEGEILFASKVMPEFQRRVPSGYSVISFDVESEQSVSGALKHEIAHGQFFQQPKYRMAVEMFWNSLPPDVKAAAQVMIGMNYDPANQQLLMNEFHAYILDGSYAGFTAEKIAAAKQYDPRFGSAVEVLAFNSRMLDASLRSLIQGVGQTIWAGSL
ncbi:MAG: hypothetical protein EBR09_08845 [Proteobacteria bacterium]|nr:hypothetical protein [Pseudomonadota bacterium]